MRHNVSKFASTVRSELRRFRLIQWRVTWIFSLIDWKELGRNRCDSTTEGGPDIFATISIKDFKSENILEGKILATAYYL